MKKIILFLLAIFFMHSCVDNNTDIPEVDFHSPGGVSSKVLSKLNVTEVGTAAYVINYNWSSGKLMSVVASNSSFSYNLQYTGNQLTKVVQTLGQGSQLVTRTSTLNYTSNKLTSISGTETSASSGPATFETLFTYTGNNPSNITRVFTQNGNAVFAENVNLLFTNNNLTTVNYFFGPVNNQVNVNLALSDYDARPNPLHTLPTAFSLSNSFLNEDAFSVLGLSINNYRKVTKAFLGGSSQDVTTYTYSLDGFPTKSVSPDIILDYEYITL